MTGLALGTCVALSARLLPHRVPSSNRAEPSIVEHMALIERTSAPSQPIAVLAKHQGVTLLHARRAHALGGPSLNEMILDEDRLRMLSELAAGRARFVYVDREISRRPGLVNGLAPVLREHFETIAVSRSGRYTAYRYAQVTGGRGP